MNRDPRASSQASKTLLLTDTIGFELLGPELGKDIKFGLKAALADGAVFPNGSTPLLIFRAAVQASIREIETHERGQLFQRFLRDGPYERGGDIPSGLKNLRLSDDETAAAITFIYAFMVNSFKGAVTELLAVAPCQRLAERMRHSRRLPPSTRLFVGDAVSVLRKSGKGVLKGADLHFLAMNDRPASPPGVEVVGVAEVKSGRKSANAINEQIDKHISRLRYGIRVDGVTYTSSQICWGGTQENKIWRITIKPSDWKLPRSFRYEKTDGGRRLIMDRMTIPDNEDQITCLDDSHWHIQLKWSKEAIAQAAYEMTFWYMERVGEIIYSNPEALPESWSRMTPAEAGRNAAKVALYYAILRCRTARENQRAITLYNTYGFGYALGMSFRNAHGKREMLWPQDLDEIQHSGNTKHRGRIHLFDNKKL